MTALVRNIKMFRIWDSLTLFPATRGNSTIRPGGWVRLIPGLLLLTASLSGGTITWTGNGDLPTEWTDGANWDSTYAPGPLADVVIALDGATVVLPAGESITINSLVLGGGTGSTETLRNISTADNGFRLHVTGSVTIASDGHLFMRGESNSAYTDDSLFVGTTLTNGGIITLNEGSIITGPITNNGTLISTIGRIYNDADWNIVIGDVANSATGAIEIMSGIDGQNSYLRITGDLTNAGSITVSTEQYLSNLGGHSAHLFVSGNLTNQASGTILDTSDTWWDAPRSITAANFDNQGTFRAHAQKTLYAFSLTTPSVGGAFNNIGHMDIAEEINIANIDTFVNSGTISIDTTGVLNLIGYSGAGTYIGIGDQFHGNGSLALTDLNVAVDSLPIFDSLDVNLSGSTLILTDSLIVLRSLTGGVIAAGGTRIEGTFAPDTLTSNVINNGTLSGGIIYGAVTNNDSVSLGVINGDLTNQVGAKVIISSAGAAVDGNFHNYGYLEFTPFGTVSADMLTVTNGQLINYVGGNIVGTPGSTSNHTFSLLADLVNHGTFESNYRLSLKGGTHYNDGTFTIHPGSNAGSGTFTLIDSAVFTNEGMLVIDTTAIVFFIGSGAIYFGDAGTISGTGKLWLSSNATGYLGQKFVQQPGGPELTITNSAIVYVDSLINQTAWTLNNATINADSVIINEGNLTLQGTSILQGPLINLDSLTIEPFANNEADILLSGPVINETSGRMAFQSNVDRILTVTIDSAFTNDGILDMRNTGTSIRAVILYVTKGWLTNTGTLNDSVSALISADIDNQGQFNVLPYSSSLDLTKINQILLNSGTIHIQDGTFFRMMNLDSLDNTGSIIVDAGMKANFFGINASGIFPEPTSTFATGDGSLDISGQLGLYDLLVAAPQKWVIDPGGTFEIGDSHVLSDTLINRGHLTLSNTTVIGDIVTNRDSMFVEYIGAKFIGYTGVVNDTGAYLQIIASRSNAATDLIADSTITNFGTLELTTRNVNSRGVEITAGIQLVNDAIGNLVISQGTSVAVLMAHQLSTTVVNAGLMTITGVTELVTGGTTEADGILINSGTLIVDTVFAITGQGTFYNNSGATVGGRGTLDVSDPEVHFINNGTLSPGGSPGIFTIDGDFAQGSTGEINIEIDSLVAGVGHDQLFITGSAALAGSLNVSLAPGFLVDGKIFQVLTYSGVDGVFDAVNGLITGQGGNFNAHIDETGVYLVGDFAGGASPPFISPIADFSAPEDSALVVLLRAFDPDSDALTFSVSVDTSAVQVSISTDSLIIGSTTNWNGTAAIEVVVSDPGSLTDTASFTLTVDPVNDAPLAFNLSGPPTNSTLIITLSNQFPNLVLQWEWAVDPDGDELQYDLVLTDSLAELPFRFPGTQVSVAWSLNEVKTLMEAKSLATISGSWNIRARDGQDSTLSANGPFNLTIINGTLALDNFDGLPTEFALHPNFPNPFNPTTTLRYDLPEASNVSLIVYDLVGREVLRMVEGNMAAGYHRVVWDGRNGRGRPASTGLYLARLVTPSYTRVIKMVLLK